MHTWYVLLLLFYSWVMPDTLHRESKSSIFFVYSPPSDEREKSGKRPRKEKPKTYRRNLLPNNKMEEKHNT